MFQYITSIHIFMSFFCSFVLTDWIQRKVIIFIMLMFSKRER